MDQVEFLRKLIQANFIGMLKNKDIKSLKEFKNNPRYLRDLLISIGASKELLEKPAHLEQLEELLKEIVEELSESLEKEKAEIGYNVKFDDENTLVVRIETFATQDDYRLKINNNGYFFQNIAKRSRIGSTKRTVQGDLEGKKIIDLKELDTLDSKKDIGKKFILDDSGFSIDETDVEKETEYISVGSFESEKKVTNKKSNISRKGTNVTNRNSEIVPWNGSALHLNDNTESKTDFYNNVLINIMKCPSSRKYYENMRN